MSRTGGAGHRQWSAAPTPATVRRDSMRSPLPWAAVLERLHVAITSGELAPRGRGSDPALADRMMTGEPAAG